MDEAMQLSEEVDPMSAMGAPSIAPVDFLTERARTGVLATLLLDTLCELAPGETSNRCGKTLCGYFDDTAGRCGLLTWDVPGRLGPEALRWFVEHRGTRRLAEGKHVDDPVLARMCSL